MHFTETLALDRSIAYSLSFDRNVSYFYQGYMDASESAGWTDERIADVLINNMDVNSAELDWTDAGIDDLMPGTEYLLCAIGFDKRGNRGDLTKINVRTRDVKVSDPWIEISSPSRDNLYFYFDTEPNGYTQSYYIFTLPGELGEELSYFPNAQIAYLMKDLIADSTLDPAARGGSWWRDNLGAYNLFISTWGVDVTGQFSAQLNKTHWIWNIPASKPALHLPKVGKSAVKMMTREQKEKIKNNIILKKVEK